MRQPMQSHRQYRHSQPRRLTIRLPALHAGQAAVTRNAARFSVLACGRRWGKTVLGVDRLVQAALYGAPVAWMSPTYRMLVEVWRTVKQQLAPVTVRVSEQQHRLDLMTGGVVEMWSLDNPDMIRGRKYGRVVVDEAAMVRDLQQSWQAVIRPTLADMGGDAWLLSSPRGRNFFWECFQRGQGEEGWRSWQMPSVSNPHIPSEEIAAMRRELPERVYLQEIEAQFLEDGGSIFRFVHEAATAPLLERPQAGHAYVMGVDWARERDYSVFVVMDMEEQRVVAMDRMSHIEYVVQLERLAALAERWHPDVIVAEQNSIGVPLIEQLQRRGLPVRPFVTTHTRKTHAIDALSLAFERGAIAIPDDPVLLNELLAFEMQRLPSGGVRYCAPAGGHDDCVMALALCYTACVREGEGLLLWSEEDTMR